MALTQSTASGVMAAARRVAVFFVALVFATGCISIEQQGDRAHEAGKYKEAQGFYKQAIAEGSEDPDLYLKAARNELQLGNLASAERFFTRALKFGGGPPVAKELARYYVETSNYASAVRVYQYLLYQVEDAQPVYNNLGTALIYAKRPFDAESYLMVAQQMDPRDPLPYLNLGLLYDQHLKQPWLAINFYACFVEMSGQVEQRRQAAQRVRELESRWSRLYDSSALECGDVYEPPTDKPVGNLAGQIGAAPEGPIDLETSTDNSPREASSIIVEKMVESVPGDSEGVGESGPKTTKVGEPERTEPAKDESKTAKEEEGAPKSVDAKVDTPVSSVRDGRKAFAKKDWQGTVDALTSVSLKELKTLDLALLGAAYFQLKQFKESAQWLETVSNREATTDYVVLLVDAYIRAGDLESAGNTCDRFAAKPDMKGVAKHCETRMEELKESRDKPEVTP